MAPLVFPIYMAKTSSKKDKGTKKVKNTKKIKKSQTKSKKPKAKKPNKESFIDDSIVIVDDDFQIDKEKVKEERRAYLEEARSQDASD